MGRSLFLASFAISACSLAETASGLAMPATDQQAAAAAVPPCELHIFPTNEIIDGSENYFSGVGSAGLGNALASAVLTSAQSSGTGKLKAQALEQMKTYLTPQSQIEELKTAGVLVVLKLPADTRIVEEAPLPRAYETPKDPALLPAYTEYMTALKRNRAIKASTSSCYRELIIVSVSVAKNLGTLKFASEFVYRTFDADYSETHLYDGQNSVPKPANYPAQPADAEGVLKSAFRTNFKEWVARRVKT